MLNEIKTIQPPSVHLPTIWPTKTRPESTAANPAAKAPQVRLAPLAIGSQNMLPDGKTHHHDRHEHTNPIIGDAKRGLAADQEVMMMTTTKAIVTERVKVPRLSR